MGRPLFFDSACPPRMGRWLSAVAVVIGGVVALAATPVAAQPAQPGGMADNPKLAFWDRRQHGANGFNKQFTAQWFADLHDAGISLARLGIGKTPGVGRDFLLGTADKFQGIPPQDLARLVQMVDDAAEHGVSVVIAPLSLPGARWVQQNDDAFDPRLWTDPAYHAQAAAFWKELATALRDKPNVVGYEIMNEPTPARALGKAGGDASDRDAWHARHVGTPADVNVLYARVHAAIRVADPHTPVVVSSSEWGSAQAVKYLKAIDDPAVIYTFHSYEPYDYTTHRINAGRFSYPGDMEHDGKFQRWDRQRIAQHVTPVAEWAQANRIPPTRIFVGEFGCDRRVPGAAEYLADSASVYSGYGWHWAFYAFREDVWDAMDYELGTKPPGAAYWAAIDRGETPNPPRGDNPLWQVIKSALHAGE